jgi:Na+-driven multidrug efflux pump
VIAVGVAMLPYAARRFGEGDLAGVRRGLRQANMASVLYAGVIVAPVMLGAGRWVAAWLAETPVTRDYTATLLLFVPLACLFSVPFLLCRPVFEAMNRGRPGLMMAVLRFVLLTAPAAWLGMRIAEGMGRPGIHGLVVGLLVVSASTAALFHLWLRGALSAQERSAQLP